MAELYPVFFEVFQLAKTVYDTPRLKRLWNIIEGIPLDEDSIYELAMEAATSVFQDTSLYYNNEDEVETWVMGRNSSPSGTDLTDLFGEKDVFLSIFNPLYFIEELGDDGKNLLERHLPMIPHETVMAQLSDATRAALEGENILSPEIYLKKKREEIRELDETIIYLRGQQDQAQSQGEDWSQTADGLAARRDALTRTITELEAKQYEGLDQKAMGQRLIELSARYDETGEKEAL